MKRKLVYKMFLPLLIMLMVVFGVTYLLVNYKSKSNMKEIIKTVNMGYIDKIINEKESKEKMVRSLKEEFDENYLKQARLVAEIIKSDSTYKDVENLQNLPNG